MTDKLKPCPFCGGRARVCGVFPMAAGGSFARCVRCDECGAHGGMFVVHAGSLPDTARERAVEAWNKRAEE